MELLSEQKRELDNVREKGIQLETAVATSAAAAAATAQRARDHEAKAASMYEQTEELMKFQFMSMSLSYFSSLNMMKQMREINADTTTAAVAGSADAAAAAAASAAAASIPSLKPMGTFGGDECEFKSLSIEAAIARNYAHGTPHHLTQQTIAPFSNASSKEQLRVSFQSRVYLAYHFMRDPSATIL